MVLLIGLGCAARSSAAQQLTPLLPLHVSPYGEAAGPCTTIRPCATFDRAYQLASPGQTVEIESGLYGHQPIYAAEKGSTARVVFRPAPGATVSFNSSVDVYASNIEFKDVRFGHGGTDVWGFSLWIKPPSGTKGSYACVDNVVIDGGGGNTFHIQNGVSNVTIKNGNWGNYPDAPGQRSNDSAFGFDNRLRCPDADTKARAATNILLESNHIGNTYQVCLNQPDSCLAGAHPDCLEWLGYTGSVTVRANTFDRCYGDFVNAASCIPARGCPYGESGTWGPVVFEGNWFGDASPSKFFTIAVGDAWEFGSSTTCRGWVFRRNTFTYTGGTSLHLACRPPGGDRSQAIKLDGNIFATGPLGRSCREGEPYFIRYVNNLFLKPPPLCGRGEGSVPFGYQFVNGRLRWDASARTVRTAFRRAVSKRALAKIARDFRQRGVPAPARTVWTVSAVKSVLANAAYLGSRWGRPGDHPAIVSAHLWKRAQRALR
jgi:hypothetical protein